MTSRAIATRALLAAGAAVLTIGLVGCTGGTDRAQPTSTPTASATPDAPPAVTDIVDTPGSGEGLVGALADSTTTTCALDGTSWTVEGTVTNPSADAASYRIYVSLLAGSGETRALQQVNVDAVAPAASAPWAASIPVPDDGLSCVLRVERYPAGAPTPAPAP